MLEHLHISNLALIEDMALDFEPGLNVLTGETGAGKSFILKALGFVLGDKLGADIVRPGADRARVEAIFSIGDEEKILRRELLAGTGRSRFYINDALASQEALRELRPSLLSHASQHAQQQLLQPAFQAQLLSLGVGAPDLMQRRERLLATLKENAAQIDDIKTRQASLLERRELLEMQKMEIEKVAPKPGEEEKLEALRSQAKANVGLKQNYKHAQALLYGEEDPGLLQLLQELEKILGAMAAAEPGLTPEKDRVADFRQYLRHLGNTLPRPHLENADKLDMDAIEERLFALAQLKRKLKRSLPEIMQLQQTIQENLSFLDICALDLSRLNKLRQKHEEELKTLLLRLLPLRHEAAARFATALEKELRELGFSEHVRVLPEFQPWEVWPGIMDERGQINWAPNPGQNPQPLDKIASGGELSRFLLAVNSLKTENNNLTFIFDEVDAGVGGLTLNKLADKLQNLAAHNQIILITHWPQLAARANRHFNIIKTIADGRTYTQCAALDSEARKREIARMAGGGKEGEAVANTLLDG